MIDSEGNRFDSVFEDLLYKLMGTIGLEGCTITDARGMWAGDYEDSKVIEILEDEADLTLDSKIFGLAKALKAVFNQQSVLVTTDTVHGSFI
jgi:hypothetical protein